MFKIETFFVCGETMPYACETFVPWPEMEPMFPALEAWSLNPWVTREILFFL